MCVRISERLRKCKASLAEVQEKFDNLKEEADNKQSTIDELEDKLAARGETFPSATMLSSLQLCMGQRFTAFVLHEPGSAHNKKRTPKEKKNLVRHYVT